MSLIQTKHTITELGEKGQIMNIITNIETITPEVAKQYLNNNINNRRISIPHVNKLCNSLLTGRWKLNPTPITFDKNGILLDGQHRLTAIIKANKAAECLVSRGWEPSTTNVIDYDSRKRSVNDVLASHDVPNAPNVASFITGLGTILYGKTPTIRQEEIYDLYEKLNVDNRVQYEILYFVRLCRDGLVPYASILPAYTYILKFCGYDSNIIDETNNKIFGGFDITSKHDRIYKLRTTWHNEKIKRMRRGAGNQYRQIDFIYSIFNYYKSTYKWGSFDAIINIAKQKLHPDILRSLQPLPIEEN